MWPMNPIVMSKNNKLSNLCSYLERPLLAQSPSRLSLTSHRDPCRQNGAKSSNHSLKQWCVLHPWCRKMSSRMIGHILSSEMSIMRKFKYRPLVMSVSIQNSPILMFPSTITMFRLMTVNQKQRIMSRCSSGLRNSTLIRRKTLET